MRELVEKGELDSSQAQQMLNTTQEGLQRRRRHDSWTVSERNLLIKGLKQYGKNYKVLFDMLPHKNAKQILNYIVNIATKMRAGRLAYDEELLQVLKRNARQPRKSKSTLKKEIKKKVKQDFSSQQSQSEFMDDSEEANAFEEAAEQKQTFGLGWGFCGEDPDRKSSSSLLNEDSLILDSTPPSKKQMLKATGLAQMIKQEFKTEVVKNEQPPVVAMKQEKSASVSNGRRRQRLQPTLCKQQQVKQE